MAGFTAVSEIMGGKVNIKSRIFISFFNENLKFFSAEVDIFFIEVD